MKLILPFIAACLLLLPSFSLAETKEIISEGTYNMGDGETPTVAESRALLQAKRTAVEEAGTYVESYSKTRNFQLTVDEIQVLASGVMEVEVLEKKRTVVGDGFNFWIKIKARVSTDKMEEMAKRVKEKSVVEDYKRIQEAYDKSQKDIEELKKQLAGAKGEKQKKQVEAKIEDDERLFRANEWSDKGNSYYMNREFDKAIKAYTSAIALDPNDAIAYYNRGTVYGEEKGQYDRAFEDYNRAIALNPNYANGYIGRGLTYIYKGQYDKAVENYNKAIELNPNDAHIYDSRGFAHHLSGNYKKAINDYSKALELNPEDTNALGNRGLVYAMLGNNDNALKDLNKAIELNPEEYDGYYGMSCFYSLQKQADKACYYLDKSIEKGYKNWDWIKKDKDFDNIRNEACYKRIMKGK